MIPGDSSPSPMLVLAVVALLAGVASPGPTSAAAQELPGGPVCVPHPPIVVRGDEGDEGFVLGHDPTGAPIYRPGSGVTAGTGTASDPYVIEGWCIVAQRTVVADPYPVAPGILLEGTSAHVLVRDNALSAGPLTRAICVWLLEAEHVTVARNDLAGCEEGVRLQSARDNVVRHNVQSDAFHAGILLDDAHHNQVRNNTVVRSEFDGIVVRHSSHNVFEGNLLQGNLAGLQDWNSTGNVYRANHFLDHVWWAMNLQGTTGLQLADNTMWGTGVQMSGEDGAHFRHTIDASNTVNDRPLVYVHDVADQVVTGAPGQVLVAHASNVTVTGVDISFASTAVLVAYSDNVTVQGNELHDNQFSAVAAVATRDLVVHNNSIHGQSANAVDLVRSTRTKVADNQVHHGGVGIVLREGSAHNVLRRNDLHNNTWGVMLFSSDHNTIRDNRIHTNRQAGLRSHFAHGNDVVGNDIHDNGLDGANGAFILFGGGNRFEENRFRDNSLSGLRLYATHDNLVERNLFEGNGRDGLQFVFGSTGNLARLNEVRNNTGAGVLFSDGTGNAAQANNIHGNDVGARAEVTSDADATENWWGCAGGPDAAGCDPVQGDVAYTPWRAEPVPGAGPSD